MYSPQKKKFARMLRGFGEENMEEFEEDIVRKEVRFVDVSDDSKIQLEDVECSTV